MRVALVAVIFAGRGFSKVAAILLAALGAQR